MCPVNLLYPAGNIAIIQENEGNEDCVLARFLTITGARCPMGASVNVDKRAEWGGRGFNMSLLALQVAPEAWWSAYLWALYKDGTAAHVETESTRRHSDGFMTEE